eukprot:1161360-Pelagomonas_calceolata.AAC.1
MQLCTMQAAACKQSLNEKASRPNTAFKWFCASKSTQPCSIAHSCASCRLWHMSAAIMLLYEVASTALPPLHTAVLHAGCGICQQEANCCNIQAAEAVARVVAGTDPQQQQQQQQQQIEGASASAPECWQGSNICSITVGMEVPVGGLLAKPGLPPLLDMDLSQ